MQKNHLYLILLAVFLLLGSCMIKNDKVSTPVDIDTAVAEAEEQASVVADLLAEASERETESEAQIQALEEAITEAERKAQEAFDLIAESQPADPALYLKGIEGETARCFPGETDWCIVAKAAPDEKFYGPCNPRNSYYGYEDVLTIQCEPPVKDYIDKRNEAYVWGLTKEEKRLFFGTAANVQCLVMQGLFDLTGMDPKPLLTSSYVCEFGCGCGGDSLSCRGDWRPPSMYMYGKECSEISTQCTTSPKLVNLVKKMLDDENIPDGEKNAAEVRRWNTLGIRSAGSHRGVVFFAGPALGGEGIHIFAFDACGNFLGSETRDTYNNIRKWLVVEDELYVGVGSAVGGMVLKWSGSKDEDLFQFEMVGIGDGNFGIMTMGMDGIAAELCEHEDRIFVSTWPLTYMGRVVSESGIWMSPPLGEDRELNWEDSLQWEKVWTVSDYEPDPVTASSYGGGALASYNGWLYWGTMNVPLAATIAHLAVYGEPQSEIDYAMLIPGTWRAIAVFRGKNFDDRRWDKVMDLRWGKYLCPGSRKITHPRWKDEFSPRWGKRYDPYCGKVVELLYGEWLLPVYYPEKGWRLCPNKMGAFGTKPMYGHSGFGNLFNNYCWTMAIYRDSLYVGSMDWSYLLFGTLGMEYAGFDFSVLNKIGIQGPRFGADLYRFRNTASAAEVVSLDGMGNCMNYGVRTMVSDEYLYLGTANPMNLHPEGGWELIRLVSH